MAASGIKTSEQVTALAHDLNKSRIGGFMLEIKKVPSPTACGKETEIVDVVEDSIIDKGGVGMVARFRQKLHKEKPVWVICSVLFKSAESNQETPLLIMFSWTPDTCPVKKRMLAASTKDAVKNSIKKCIAGIIEVQLNSPEDLDLKHIQGQITKVKNQKMLEIDGVEQCDHH